MPRETESQVADVELQPKFISESQLAKEEFELFIDLRVDGIPNDETCQDEHCLQRVGEPVR